MVSEFLQPVHTLAEFFATKIKQAIQLQSLTVSAEVEFYLVRLLSHYAISENLFSTNTEGHVENRALALRLADAVFDHPDKKFQHLKNLGDTALYQAGVFYDGLFNQVVNVDYYISMGGQAYQSLANLTTTSERSMADLFAELSERFPKLVEVLKLSCESDVQPSDHDLFRLLERYQKTGSEKAKQLLKEKGISPDLRAPTKTAQ